MEKLFYLLTGMMLSGMAIFADFCHENCITIESIRQWLLA